MKRNNKNLGWKIWSAAMMAAGLALVVISAFPRSSPESSPATDDPAWYSCFDDAGRAMSAGADPRTAYASVAERHEDAARRENLQRIALARLHADRRWSDPGQVESLTDAVEQTRHFVEENDREADDAMTTMGCLEDY